MYCIATAQREVLHVLWGPLDGLAAHLDKVRVGKVGGICGWRLAETEHRAPWPIAIGRPSRPFPSLLFPLLSLQMANGTEALLRGLDGAYPILTDLEALGADMNFTALQRDLQVGSGTGRGRAGPGQEQHVIYQAQGVSDPGALFRLFRLARVKSQ